MGKTFKTILGLLVLLIVVWAIVQLASNEVSQEEPVSDRVTIGLMVSEEGDGIRDGVELALSEGDVEDVELIERVVSCDGAAAGEAVRTLVREEGIVALIEGGCAEVSREVARVAEELGIVLMNVSDVTYDLEAESFFTYHLAAHDARRPLFAAVSALDRGYDRVAVLFEDAGEGNVFAEDLLERIPAQGGHIVGSESFEPGVEDVRGLLKAFEGGELDLIYVVTDTPETVVSILPQIAEFDFVGVTIASSVEVQSEDLLEVPEAAEGLLVTTLHQGTEDFQIDYAELYGSEPGRFAPQAHDALVALAWAVEDGATTPETIRDFLNDLVFDGASGEVVFDERGNVGANFDLWTFVGDVFVNVNDVHEAEDEA